MRNLYNWFIDMDKKLLGAIIIFNMILGLALSRINDKYEHFFLLQSLVTTVLVIEIIVLKLYKKKIIDLYCYIKPNSITGCNYAQMRKDNCSLKVRLMAGGFGFISNIFFFVLHLVPINSLGVYICILLYVTLYFSMIGYIQVILFMKFLKQFNVNDINLINKIFPQNNQMLKVINEIINLQAVTFAIIGMIYTLIYTIIAPKPVTVVSTLIQDYKGKCLGINHIILFYTWLQIICLIITAFFVILLLSKKIYRKILMEFNDKFQIEICTELNKDKHNFSTLEYFTAAAYVYEIVDKMEQSKKTKINDRQIYIISALFHLISFTILMSDLIVALENIETKFLQFF